MTQRRGLKAHRASIECTPRKPRQEERNERKENEEKDDPEPQE